ncbi:helix-turn-helix transcriptional regulator [Pseudomonas sp. NY15437]|uniref:helix-turn-helix transcriptional regulator n=1 Tax=Pseudomonas sp. NY15437 TaxID=3400360 RepID=UPI003A8B8BFC
MYKDRIRAARAYAHLSQMELARMVGMNQTSISELERGYSASSRHTAAIARACGVSEIWLERGEGQMVLRENPRAIVESGKHTY